MSKFNNLVIMKFLGIIVLVLKICFGEEIFRKKPDLES